MAKKNSDEVVETISEAVEAPVEAEQQLDDVEVTDTGFDPSAEPVEEVAPQYIVAGEGDSYAALAARLAPEGVRSHDYARELVALNAGKPVRPGTRIRLY